MVFSADAQTSSNSVVRFRISYGSTFFGNIDVELFNDKPITVTNFLRYVQSGAYERSFLHSVEPGVGLQGGGFTIPNPYSSAPFEFIQLVPTNAPITNEFFVGTLRSNVFGTLAMSKTSTTDPNSANSQWFFNLGDNSSIFDVENGGSTVFGRVKSGLNVLSYFNTVSLNNGYLNQTNGFYEIFCPLVTLVPSGAVGGFGFLPVGFLGFDCVHYSDLFAVQTIMLNGPDVTSPKGVITFPAANAVVTNDFITVQGTASDNLAVGSVQVYLNTNSPLTATGTNAWSIALTNIPPGTNTLTVEVVDTTGNRSQITRQFFRRVLVPLSLTFDPAGGTVTGATNTQLLDLTRGYKLVAKPKRGYLFDGWTGTVASAGTTIPFIMESNTALTAIFVTNLFPWIKGTYNGLFYDTNHSQVELESSGFLTLRVGDFGAYSGKLLKDGKSYPFRGTFGVDGTEFNFVERRGTNLLLIRMALDLTNGTDMLSGIVSNFFRWETYETNASTITTNRFTNQWSAVLEADRAVWNSRANPSPMAGKYTVLIAADTNTLNGPPGESFGKATVGTGGIVTLSGTLADTTKATQKISLSKSNQWPLYIPLHKGKGALLSWVKFDPTQTETDLGGALSWIKQGQPTAKYYKAGFTNDTQIAGSAFVTPVSPDRILDLTTGVVAFTGGNLATDFTNRVTLGADNKVINGSTNKLILSIQKSSGLMTGSVTPPEQTRSLPFKGAVLQKQNRAGGFIPGTNETGRVDFTAE